MGDHFYTTSATERDAAVNKLGYLWEGISCYLLTECKAGSIPFYRLVNKKNDHFYTTDISERDRAVRDLGYVYEGVTGYVFPGQAEDTSPLYRLVRDADLDHAYSTDLKIVETMEKYHGYKREGVAAYVYTQAEQEMLARHSKTTALFALYTYGPQYIVRSAKTVDLMWIAYPEVVNLPFKKNPDRSLATQKLVNNSQILQNQSIKGEKTVSDTSQWTTGVEFKTSVTTSVGASIPFIVDGKVEITVELGLKFDYSKTHTVERVWSWDQPVKVAPYTAITATTVISEGTVSIPYLSRVNLTFADGTQISCLSEGFYEGGNGYDLETRYEERSLSKNGDASDSITRTASLSFGHARCESVTVLD